MASRRKGQREAKVVKASRRFSEMKACKRTRQDNRRREWTKAKPRWVTALDGPVEMFEELRHESTHHHGRSLHQQGDLQAELLDEFALVASTPFARSKFHMDVASRA